jgi:hypothetical protein
MDGSKNAPGDEPEWPFNITESRDCQSITIMHDGSASRCAHGWMTGMQLGDRDFAPSADGGPLHPQ